MRPAWIFLIVLISMSCGNNPPTAETDSHDKKPVPPKLLVETVDTMLAGSWELESLPMATRPIDQLFPRQRPMILIQPELKLISGTTGCNRFSATLSANDSRISIQDFTRSSLVCVGEAESNFLNAFENSNRFRFPKKDELVWGTDSVTWMVFRRR